jgi:hypothetical protein
LDEETAEVAKKDKFISSMHSELAQKQTLLQKEEQEFKTKQTSQLSESSSQISQLKKTIGEL